MTGGFVLSSLAIGWMYGSYGSVIMFFTNSRTGQIQIHSDGYLEDPSIYDTIDSSAEIGFAQPDVGRIDSVHITDEWQIASTTEGDITVTVVRISGNLLPLVSLFDENGMLIRETEADGDGRATLSVELTADTRYRIAVSRSGLSGGLTEGDYAIEVTTPTTE